MPDPVGHDPIDTARGYICDDIRPIAVVVADGERGAASPVVPVQEIGAKATYPPGRSPALVRHVEVVVGLARRAILRPATNGRSLANEAIR